MLRLELWCLISKSAARQVKESSNPNSTRGNFAIHSETLSCRQPNFGIQNNVVFSTSEFVPYFSVCWERNHMETYSHLADVL